MEKYDEGEIRKEKVGEVRSNERRLSRANEYREKNRK